MAFFENYFDKVEIVLRSFQNKIERGQKKPAHLFCGWTQQAHINASLPWKYMCSLLLCFSVQQHCPIFHTMAALHDFMISELKLNQQRSIIPIVADNAKVPLSLRRQCFGVQSPSEDHSRNSRAESRSWGSSSLSSSDGGQSVSSSQEQTNIPRLVQHPTRLPSLHRASIPPPGQPMPSSTDGELADESSKKEAGKKRNA
jgi:hypothetical protein